MAECVVLPITTSVQPVPLAEPAAEAEAAVAGFTLEEVPPDESPGPAEAGEDAPAEVPAPDPLQMLIEDLSGISGALREAAPQAAEKTVPAEPEVMLPEIVQKSALPVTLDAMQACEVPSKAMLAEAPKAETATDNIEALPPDPLTSHSHGAPVTPAEIRPPKAAATPVPVARQIAEAMVTARDDVVEIALAPEELGRIRMVMSGPEHSPHVVVWVERPEVLDQMRRNAAFLQECLSDSGMAGASFEFQGDRHPGPRDDWPAPLHSDALGLETFDQMQAIPMAWTPMAIPARLDIRI
ncbi:flagellar hook-length control protein FliK [Paracoccus sp. SSK6]|uniref:flagellar hook-length control protein FliK n=1 Tax=Paracoccus sp. SSK6 TaxID=3143131 RepID=UPI00321A3F24